jgi:ABC-type multidrug transport system ATPase subunit
MEVLMQDRTSLIIAHRLSTIRRAGRIVFIKDGRIAKMGTHAELLRARGRYYQLYTAQFRQELEQRYGVLKSPTLAAAWGDGKVIKLESAGFPNKHLACYESALMGILKYMGLANETPLMGTQAYFAGEGAA